MIGTRADIRRSICVAMSASLSQVRAPVARSSCITDNVSASCREKLLSLHALRMYGTQQGWRRSRLVLTGDRGPGLPTHCSKEKEMRVVAATEGLTRNAVVLRISIGLIAKATRDLRRTQERSGLSVADTVNRALTLYEFVDSCRASGDQI